MSRFWQGDSSSEEGSSGDDSSNYSSEEEDKQTGNKWAELSDSDDSDDEVRVVKSGKERAIDTFEKHVGVIRKAMKSRDYYQISTEFDELSKDMIKAKNHLAEGVPRFLVRILVDLEDYIAERLQDKAQFKKLSARQVRALNKMKLTVKKHNKPYSVVTAEYRKNPVVDDSDDEKNEDGGDDDAGSSSSSSSSSNSDGAAPKKRGGGGGDSVRGCSNNAKEFYVFVAHHKDANSPPRGVEFLVSDYLSCLDPTYVAVKAVWVMSGGDV
jgi:translation initiation factor 3 subunit C